MTASILDQEDDHDTHSSSVCPVVEVDLPKNTTMQASVHCLRGEMRRLALSCFADAPKDAPLYAICTVQGQPLAQGRMVYGLI